MGLLALVGLAMQEALRQTILTRGQAQDYTTARFLLERIHAEIELQPQHIKEEKEGQFPAPYDRFSYHWKISKVDIPKPTFPAEVPKELREYLEKQFKDYMAKVDIWIRWQRAGHTFEIHAQDLFQPEKLWLPPPVQ